MNAGEPVIVDTHFHFQDISSGRYAWLANDAPLALEGDLSPIRRNFLLEDYLRNFASLGVAPGVHIENGWDRADPDGEVRWIENLTLGTNIGLVAYADLAGADIEQRLEALIRHRAVRGIRDSLSWDSDPVLRVAKTSDRMNEPSWRRGLSLLSRLHLSFELQIFWHQMDGALELARSLPDTRFILTHMGLPVHRDAERLGCWRKAIVRLSSAPNVFVKLSGLGLGQREWSLPETVPILRHAIEAFGPSRTMVGTNWPVDLLFGPVERIVEALLASVEDLSRSEQALVLRQNAIRTYRLS